MTQNFQNFRHFFDFCTNHERSNFGIKKSTFFFSKNCQNLADFYDFLRMFLLNLIEPKLQPIDAAPVDVFEEVKNCQNLSNFVDFSQVFRIFKKQIFVPIMNDLILE